MGRFSLLSLCCIALLASYVLGYLFVRKSHEATAAPYANSNLAPGQSGSSETRISLYSSTWSGSAQYHPFWPAIKIDEITTGREAWYLPLGGGPRPFTLVRRIVNAPGL